MIKILLATKKQVAHNFSTGIEKIGKGFWIFDELSTRLSLNYLIYTAHIGGTSQAKGTLVSFPATTDGFTVSAGLGIRRGIGSLDLALVLGDWEGSIVGPKAASATITVDFGRKDGNTSTTTKSSTEEEKDEFDLDL